MDPATCRRLASSTPVARLATMRSGGPHIVPVVFAVSGDHIYTAVDHKPKRSHRLQRLENIRRNPAVSVLADHYEDDWRNLWWVRADGNAAVVDDPTGMQEGIDLLVARYAQYAARRPEGPLVVITVASWTGWSARQSLERE